MKDIQISFPNEMHYSANHKALLPSRSHALPMPDTRLEALWLLLCLEGRRRMLPCQAGPLGQADQAGFRPCFQAADHVQKVRLGSKTP